MGGGLRLRGDCRRRWREHGYGLRHLRHCFSYVAYQGRTCSNNSLASFSCRSGLVGGMGAWAREKGQASTAAARVSSIALP